MRLKCAKSQHTFAHRRGSLHQQRWQTIVILHFRSDSRAAAVGHIDSSRIGRLAANTRYAIGEAMLWCCVGHDAAQKSCLTAPREEPVCRVRQLWVYVDL